jgi:hypothetical protein
MRKRRKRKEIKRAPKIAINVYGSCKSKHGGQLG